jgi:hypothetical protein
MASRTDFTDTEWERLGRSPLIAGMAISLADPGGPIEALKETSAALRTVVEAAQGGTHGDFVRAVATDVAARAQHRHNPLGDFKPKGADAPDEILAELREVNALLVAKASPEEAADFRDWLRSAAQASALAAKEGGFLGFNAQRVSENEQQMLEKLGTIFSDPA